MVAEMSTAAIANSMLCSRGAREELARDVIEDAADLIVGGDPVRVAVVVGAVAVVDEYARPSAGCIDQESQFQ
jgi:hypothetical protein